MGTPARGARPVEAGHEFGVVVRLAVSIRRPVVEPPRASRGEGGLTDSPRHLPLAQHSPSANAAERWDWRRGSRAGWAAQFRVGSEKLVSPVVLWL